MSCTNKNDKNTSVWVRAPMSQSQPCFSSLPPPAHGTYPITILTTGAPTGRTDTRRLAKDGGSGVLWGVEFGEHSHHQSVSRSVCICFVYFASLFFFGTHLAKRVRCLIYECYNLVMLVLLISKTHLFLSNSIRHWQFFFRLQTFS